MKLGIRAAAMVAVALSMSMGPAARSQETSPTSRPEPQTAASAQDTSPTPHHLDKCPDNLGDFENSDATKKFVQKCLGRPNRVMSGRGSDVIWFYSAKGGEITLVMVFDEVGALTRFRAYAQNRP
jgi:hypothetical protein